MRRTIFLEEHDRFRALVRDFFRDEVLPEHRSWAVDGQPPRWFWRRCGELGLLAAGVPAEYGGFPDRDFRYNAILTETAQEFGLALGGLRVQTDICLPYLLEAADDAQRAEWLPRMVSGDAVVSLAISEPGAGSDIKSMTTTAVRDGDAFVVNGSKTFISNGATSDLVILAVRSRPEGGREGLSLLLVDTTTPGFERGRTLHKLGLKEQDLAELFFRDMRVPVSALLGVEHGAFAALTSNLAQERLSIAVNSQASAAAALHAATSLFSGGRNPQSVKFALADSASEVAAGQALIDQALAAHVSGTLLPEDAAAVKLFCTEMQSRVIDRCVQAAGLEHFTADGPLGRAYADGRVSRIYGGSSEILRVIVAKSLGL